MHDTCIYIYTHGDVLNLFQVVFLNLLTPLRSTISLLFYTQYWDFILSSVYFNQNVKEKCGASCMVKIVRRPFQRRLISLMWFSVPGFGIRIFFPQISDTAIWHFILDVISYLLSKSEFTVPLKNESPHGREVKKHCFIIPRSKEPC